jgi:hypothetical protein
LESLDDWLRGEHSLAGRVRLTGPTPRVGELGAVTDALVVAIGSGGAISVVGAALAGALKGWLSLSRRSDVSIKIHRADGNSVEIDAKRVKAGDVDIEAAIRKALDLGSALALDSGTAEE